jgi:hypothetical protein
MGDEFCWAALKSTLTVSQEIARRADKTILRREKSSLHAEIQSRFLWLFTQTPHWAPEMRAQTLSYTG